MPRFSSMRPTISPRASKNVLRLVVPCTVGPDNTTTAIGVAMFFQEDVQTWNWILAQLKRVCDFREESPQTCPLSWRLPPAVPRNRPCRPAPYAAGPRAPRWRRPRGTRAASPRRTAPRASPRERPGQPGRPPGPRAGALPLSRSCLPAPRTRSCRPAPCAAGPRAPRRRRPRLIAVL